MSEFDRRIWLCLRDCVCAIVFVCVRFYLYVRDYSNPSVLCFDVLCFAVLCYSVLCCSVLCFDVLCCSVLYCDVMFCTVF